MLVQIYSLTHPDDVRICADAGVDHIGVAAGSQDLPASISNDRARELFDLAPAGMTTVALTVATDLDEIVDYAEAVAPDILHICSDTHAVDVADMRELRERVPGDMDLMKAVNVVGPASVDVAASFDDVCDWFILDTATEDVDGVGASGETHDWSVSREIVDTVDTPVILAGGLSPENVAESVRAVRPAGVDSYTHTSRSEERKDPEKVAVFVEEARRAAAELPPQN